jgi:hypothetical protein
VHWRAQFGFVRVLPANVANGAEDGELAAGDGVVDAAMNE